MRSKDGNTKAKILDTALDLFSQRGYSAVSIRDIGGVVGIKESTIYYYFKNKQDIFDTLIQNVMELTEETKSKFNERFDQISKLKRSDFIMVGIGVLSGFLLDQWILKFIRMLMIEQHVNENAAAVYRQILIETPLRQNEKVFQRMMDKGYFKQDVASCLASEYYGIIYFVFMRYFGSGEATPEKKVTAEREISDNLGRFYDRYCMESEMNSDESI